MRLITGGVREQLLKADSLDTLDQLSKDIEECIEKGVLKDIPARTKSRWSVATDRRRFELNKPERKEKK
jgi:hypothetical protein